MKRDERFGEHRLELETACEGLAGRPRRFDGRHQREYSPPTHFPMKIRCHPRSRLGKLNDNLDVVRLPLERAREGLRVARAA